MTSNEPGKTSYGPSPRQGLPGWIWGIGACACLPIAGIVALGLLAAPGLKRIKEANREAARGRSCLANVKQIATAMQMYAQDYDDHLPPSAAWMDASGAYAERSGGTNKPVLKCPTVQVTHPAGYGYALNTKFAGKPFSKIATPAIAQLVYDSSSLDRNASDSVTSLPSPARHRTPSFRPGRGQYNVMGYVDGHAKAVNDQGKALQGRGADRDQ